MDSEKHLFSLISVVKNNSKGLQCTLDSIYEQTVDTTRFQTVVIDGSDEEDLQYIVDAYNIDVYSTEKDNGIYDAMNKGVQYANGMWTLFLNSGDTFASCDALERIADVLLQTQDIVIEHSYAVVCTPVIEIISGRAVLLSTKSIHKMPLHMPTSHQGMLFKTTMLKQYTFNTLYQLCADLDLFARILRDGYRVVYYNHPITRIDGVGRSNIHWKKTLSERMQIQQIYYPGILQYIRMYVFVCSTIFKKIVRKILPVSLVLFIRSKIHKKTATQ